MVHWRSKAVLNVIDSRSVRSCSTVLDSVDSCRIIFNKCQPGKRCVKETDELFHLSKTDILITQLN